MVLPVLVAMLTPALGRAAPGAQDLPGASVQAGANFYALETWDPGRKRRWMSNNGEVLILNETGQPQHANMRFHAFSFRSERDLHISMDGRVVAKWVVYPTGERYVVVKGVLLRPGRNQIVLYTPQPALVPARVGNSTDLRALSVAFSPFSVIAASAPSAQLEWTAAFPAWTFESKFFSTQENAANNFSREGRLPEAARAYELALSDGASVVASLFYGAVLLALERQADALGAFRQCANRQVRGVRETWVRGLCQHLGAYVGESPILAQTSRDPGRRSRMEGKIFEAVETYEQVLTKQPDALHANYWLGVLNAIAWRRAEARLRMERVIALVGDTSDGRFLRFILGYL